MVGLGLLMAAVGVWAAWLRVRGRLYTSRWLRRAVLAMAPSGFIALLAGWTVTEVGRQPFTVYGLLRTADSVSPVGLPGVAVSLAAFVVVYAIVFGAGFVFLLRLMRRPPTVGESGTADRRTDPQRRHHAGRRVAGCAAMMLTVIWAGLIAFAVLAYVLLDGFDLGVGILFAVERRDEDRDVMLNSIAPVWDGNETWLVFGGGGLFAMFPLAYAVILPALYPAIIAMLLALVFRGVGFEFRFRAASERGRMWWDRAFCAGSTLAAFCQGLVLGGLLQGIRVQDRAYAGGWWDWLTGFTVAVRRRRRGRVCAAGRVLADLAMRRAAAAAGAAVCARTGGGDARVHRCRQPVDTAAQSDVHAERWFGWPGIVLTSPVPILVALVGWLFWRGLSRRHHVTPLLCAQAWFVLCYAGLGISLWPMIVPPSQHHDLGCGRTGVEPGVPAGWRGGADPDHPGLHRLRLLGVPRQGAAGNALSLIAVARWVSLRSTHPTRNRYRIVCRRRHGFVGWVSLQRYPSIGGAIHPTRTPKPPRRRRSMRSPPMCVAPSASPNA